MVVVFPFHEGDYAQLLNQLQWVRQLGGAKGHTALLVADGGVAWRDALRALSIAQESFGSAEVIAGEDNVVGWPGGPNAMFLTAAKHQRNKSPWLWMETDAVPLKAEWLDLIALEYEKQGKPYMGHIYECAQPGLPSRLMSGIGVYPANAHDLFSPVMAKNMATAFDVALANEVLNQAAHTGLIHHFWGKNRQAPTFGPLGWKLEQIQSGAVIFHRCKDGTLLEALRVKAGISHLPVQEQRSRQMISVRRTAAIGDVLASTVVATKLMEQGFDVSFQSHPSTHCVLRRLVPKLKEITTPDHPAEIDLDGAYEHDQSRKQKHFATMFVARANMMLRSTKITNFRNFAPRMEAVPSEVRAIEKELEQWPRPWVMIVPRSANWNHRTVPDPIWHQAAQKIMGTKFWLALHPGPGSPIVDLGCRHFDKVINYLAAADILVTVDTGPMHVAAALGTPLVAIQQSSSPALHLSDQRDWQMISPNLTCLNCQLERCPINNNVPPCQNIDPQTIADAVNTKLLAFTNNDVSAVISIYKPNVEKLNRCLAHVLPQVAEVVVVSDTAGYVPKQAMQHSRIRYVRKNEHDLGYGRKANYGVRHSNNRWVLLLNDDVYLAPDAVEKMMAVVKFDTGLVAGELRYPNGTIQHGGTYRNPGMIGWGHLDHNAHESRIKEPMEMENVTGAAVLVRREAFYQADGFDGSYFLYCEDNDLCMKIRQAGWRVMYTPHSKGIHEEHQSTMLTANLHNIMVESQKIFAHKWADYFHRNRHNSMGTFE